MQCNEKVNGAIWMKKIMFFDIDGTLIGFNNHGEMTDKMIEALHKLRENDVKIGIATGRQTTVYAEKFKSITPMDFIIGSNGREVLIEEAEIYSEPIPQTVIERLITFDDQYQVGLLLSSNADSATYNPPTEKCVKYIEGLALTAPTQNKDFYLTNDIVQAMIFCDEATELIFHQAFPELHFIRHNNDGIDIVTAGPLKEKGIEVVLEHYGYEKSEALAFGDGLNDVGMFSYIDGVCLGVAHPELEKLAIEQVDTVENDGIYQYLRAKAYFE